jgi:hypothetical protein
MGGHAIALSAASLAITNISYAYRVCNPDKKIDTAPKIIVKVKIANANQNVHHCSALRRSVQTCFTLGGGEENS